MHGDFPNSTNNKMSLSFANGIGKCEIFSIAIECYLCAFDYK